MIIRYLEPQGFGPWEAHYISPRVSHAGPCRGGPGWFSTKLTPRVHVPGMTWDLGNMNCSTGFGGVYGTWPIRVT